MMNIPPAGAPQTADDPAAQSPQPEAEQSASPAELSFPVVGIGASAGGLAAFEAFFSAIPPDTQTGMAFVLVQHLDPNHKSILAELIKRHTCMQVHEIVDGLRIKPDCVYIIPPNVDMALFNGLLHLLEPAAPRGQRLPIDFFFRSLAQDQHERALCVVLSGTGSDGTLGARAIKGEGGMVMAQAPKTAAYDGMPRSAIATGLVDFVLPPAEMPAQLMAYVTHAFGREAHTSEPSSKSVDTLTKICLLLRDKSSHDFSQYKQSTLIRRIERRMALHQIEQQRDYVRYLQHNPLEIDALFHDLLIGVTSFFRDPEAFAILEHEVIPRLFHEKPAGSPVRVWICGCSTGEEAYSIAILLKEHLETLKQDYRLQIFATDIDANAIERARSGIYPANIATDISPERLARFFVMSQEQGCYRINKEIRDLLVFSEQDLIKDPPFSRLDLISCRNLLIYLNGDLQRRLIPLFHYALKSSGFLFLGNSETIGDAHPLFTPVDRKWKLFATKEQQDVTLTPLLPQRHMLSISSPHTPSSDPESMSRSKGKSDLRKRTEQALLRHYDPTALLVTGRGDIRYIYGRTGQFLEPAPGDPTMNVFSMAREGLCHAMRNALQRVVTTGDSVRLKGLRVKTNGDFTLADLSVHPEQRTGHVDTEPLYLAILEITGSVEDGTGQNIEKRSKTGESDSRIAELEQELRTKEEYLQTTLEEMETSNEELKSTNEEMQSVNEELQSTNEELETSKEELQSVNEELATVNTELQAKVADLSRVNNDMNNLLAGTGVATLFVDHQLRITRFTPATTRLINLIQSDVGRPVGDIVSNLTNYDDLTEDLAQVLNTLQPAEKEVRTRQGDWYVLRIGPYRTLNNVIEGAVITFMDISARRKMEESLKEARAFAEGIVDAVREPLLVLSGDLHVISANHAFQQFFQLPQSEIIDQPLSDLDEHRWNDPELRRQLLETIAKGKALEDHVIGYESAATGSCSLSLNARRIVHPDADHDNVLITIKDTSPRVDTPKSP
ncbi:PAS domain-containing protein [Marichromatium sp. AB32]|nr:PAS domain-containing protein [Marichromatium sp. AB32]